MNDYRVYLNGSDKLEAEWVEKLRTLNAEQIGRISDVAAASRVYVRDIINARSPVRQPKARMVLMEAIRTYELTQGETQP